MGKMSKNLKNLFKIRGGKENLNEFKTRIKKEFDIIKIKFPKCKLEKINSSFINKNWNQKINLEKTILIGKKENNIIIAFANPEFENVIIDLIRELKLDADYTYLLEDDKNGVIVREFFQEGESMLGDEFESFPFSIDNYNFSYCFRNMFAVTV